MQTDDAIFVFTELFFTKFFTKLLRSFYEVFLYEIFPWGFLSTQKIFLGVFQALEFFRLLFCYSSENFVRGFVSIKFFDTLQNEIWDQFRVGV